MDPSANRFNVPRLPTVVLQNLMENFNPIELFNISQCSRKMRKNIKLAGTQKYKLGLDYLSSVLMINSTWVFRINRKSNENKYDVHGSRCFRGVIASVSFKENNELISFWEEPYLGLNTVYFHLSTLFDCPTDCIEFTRWLPINIFFSAVDFLCTRQSKIQILTIAADRLTGEAVIRILNKIRCGEELTIRQKTSNVPEKCAIPLEAQIIRIFPAPWITFDHLDSMRNCLSIELLDSI